MDFRVDEWERFLAYRFVDLVAFEFQNHRAPEEFVECLPQLLLLQLQFRACVLEHQSGHPESLDLEAPTLLQIL